MNTPEKIYLITKGDDLGSNDSANRAFLDSYKKGILKNGSIMMTCAAAQKATDMFRNEKGFCVGLHMTMTSEWDGVKWGPLTLSSKVPSLVDVHGDFFPTVQKLRDNSPVRAQVFAEMQAQLDLARKFGLSIKFVDAHMDFPRAVEGFQEEFMKWRQSNGIVLSTNDFKPLPDVEAGGDPVEKLIARLKAAKPGVYYHRMGHPAYDTAEMHKLEHTGLDSNTVAEGRDWDRRTAMDARILTYCRDNGVVPVTLEEAYEVSI